MATSLSILNAKLKATNDSSKELRILGASYHTDDPELLAFAAVLKASEEFDEDWPALKAALFQGLEDPRGPVADAKLLILFSHYQILVRDTANTGHLFPANMMNWIGKGKSNGSDAESHPFPAENTIWFLLETEQIGSEAARDVINVVGGEITFLEAFYEEEDDVAVLEQVGIYLAMLLHLRLKWPDYYAWMPMHARMCNMRELLLMGSDELPVIHARGKAKFVTKEVVEVYNVLSKTMYQTSFFVRLRDYAAELKAHKGELTPAAIKLRSALFAD